MFGQLAVCLISRDDRYIGQLSPNRCLIVVNEGTIIMNNQPCLLLTRGQQTPQTNKRDWEVSVTNNVMYLQHLIREVMLLTPLEYQGELVVASRLRGMLRDVDRTRTGRTHG